jgi:hypothetical protein
VSGLRGADRVSWSEVRLHGVPYAAPRIGAHLAAVQSRADSELAARSAAAVRRELDWLQPSGRERIFHPLCGPGNYAHHIASTVGCRTYTGHDINPAAVAVARRRCTDQRYRFVTARFDAGSRAPDNDLTLLTYETVNTYAPEDLRAVLTGLADRVGSDGRIFVDVRPRSSPGVVPVAPHVRHVPEGEGIFLPEAHTVEYAAAFDADQRLYLERFVISTGELRREFFSWLWLYEPDELSGYGEQLGLAEVDRARLHSAGAMDSPGGGHSVQLVFRRRK